MKRKKPIDVFSPGSEAELIFPTKMSSIPYGTSNVHCAHFWKIPINAQRYQNHVLTYNVQLVYVLMHNLVIDIWIECTFR